jgi:N-lysine methyltransferase SETD6
MKDQVRRYYFNIVAPLLSKLEPDIHWCLNPTLDGFYRAYSLVSSRAFLVDAYHCLAMVPIADA